MKFLLRQKFILVEDHQTLIMLDIQRLLPNEQLVGLRLLNELDLIQLKSNDKFESLLKLQRSMLPKTFVIIINRAFLIGISYLLIAK